MPSYKGERVHGVSLLAMGVVPGTVDNQTCVGEVCTKTVTKHAHTHTHVYSLLIVS